MSVRYDGGDCHVDILFQLADGTFVLRVLLVADATLCSHRGRRIVDLRADK
jgi:hypothetical protein